VKDQRVERQIPLDAARVEKGHQLGHVVGGEVDRPGSSVEAVLQAKIDGIGTVFNGGPRTVPVACRSHQLRFSTGKKSRLLHKVPMYPNAGGPFAEVVLPNG